MKKKSEEQLYSKSVKDSIKLKKPIEQSGRKSANTQTKSHINKNSLKYKIKKAFELCELKDKNAEVSTQDTLPFKEIYENGICRVDDDFYIKTIEFFDINYKLAPEETQRHIFDGYCHFINYFDEKIDVQFSFINGRTDQKDVDEVISIPIIDDDLKELREEYSDMIRKQYSMGNSGISRKKYITFGVHEKLYKDAAILLGNIEMAVINNFKAMGVKSRTVPGNELLNVLYKIMHYGSKRDFNYEPEYEDKKTKDGIVIKSITDACKDAIAPRLLDFTEKDYFRMDNSYCMVSEVKMCSPDFDDSTLIDALSIDESMVITLKINALNMTKGIKQVKEKLIGENAKKVDENKKALNNGYDMAILPPGLQRNIEGCKDYYDGLAKDGEKLIYGSMLIATYGRSKKQLDFATDKVAKIFETKNHEVYPLSDRQIEAFKSMLPLCKDLVGRPRSLLTTHVALFMPFTSQELFMKGESLYYGLNSLSNNLIMCDKKQLNNPNSLILGKPGAGKSFATKREIFNSFIIGNDDVIITDPEGEYHTLVKKLHGQVITISNRSNDHINPMDVNLDVIYHPEIYNSNDSEEYEDAETLIKDKFEFLCSFCEMICCTSGDKGKTELSGEDVSAIDAATKTVYERFFENEPTYEKMPILEDFYNELSRMAYLGAEEAKFEGIPINVQNAAAEIVGKMRTYINGSNNIYNHRTNIDLNNRVICFNIKNLGKNLRRIGMFIIQNMVWTRVSMNRTNKKYTRYYVDEFHLLLGHPQTAQYSVEIFKRFRKYGGMPCGVTQNVKDLLISSQVENIFSNCDFILMLNQSADDRKILANKLKISPDQEECIRDVPPGQGLIYYGGVIIPFIDKYPTDTKSYKLMTTKLDEVI